VRFKKLTNIRVAFVENGYEEEEKLDWACCERRWVCNASFRGENGGNETERKTKVLNDR